MRNYWLKIVLGALGVFAVGMVAISVTRTVIAKVKTVTQSSDPISIPLAFVPFRLDGDRLGTFDRAVLIRKSPKQVSSLRLGVKLTDSSAAARLAGCDLLAKFKGMPHGHGAEFNDADFECVKGDSVAATGAERFGEVGFEPGHLTLALYVPPEVARDFRKEASADRADTEVDSISVAAERMGDSISEAAARLGDSVARVSERRGDSIAAAARQHAERARERAHRLRDSIRAARPHE